MSAEGFQQIYLSPKNKPYQRILLDVLRIFRPDFQWAKQAENYPYIDVLEDASGRLSLDFNGHIYPVDCQSLQANEQKRALKVALYTICRQIYQAPDNPWGILTNIRPTKIVHRFFDRGLTAEDINRRLTEDFLLSPQKAALLLQVSESERCYLHTAEEAKRLVSVYISIPFCPTKCLYCSFPSFTIPKPKLLEDYLAKLHQEITVVGDLLKNQGYQVESVYIGGGTPTVLNAKQLDNLLQSIWQAFGQKGFREFSVEAGRPDTIDREKLRVLRENLVGRISINPQTMWEPTLGLIGRHHTTADVLEKYQLAREAGFAVINMDLILGLPQENLVQLQYTLAKIHDLQPENLTIHTLAQKRASRLTMEKQSVQNDNTTVQAMADYVWEWLAGEKYTPYYLYRQKQMIAPLENIGYTLPGYASLYNIQMMEERQHILGLGVGAASKYIHVDDWTLETVNNPKDVLLYLERIDEIIGKKIAKLQAL